MRSTTACGVAVLERALQRGDQVLGAGLASAAISPRTSISAVCGPLARHVCCARRTAPHSKASTRQQPGQAEEHAPAALGCGARAATRWRAASARSKLDGPRGATGVRGAAAAACVAGRRPAEAGFLGAHGELSGGPSAAGSASSKTTGRMSREGYQYTVPSRSAAVSASGGRCRRARRRSGRRPARTPRRGSSTGSSACRMSRNSPFLPIHLGRHVGAAVDVATTRPSKRNAKRARRLRATASRRTPPPCRARQLVAGAQRLLGRDQVVVHQRMLASSQSCSSRVRMRDEQRIEFGECLVARARRSSRPRTACRH